MLIVARTSGVQLPVGGLEVMLLRLAAQLGVAHRVVLASCPDSQASGLLVRHDGESFERFYPASVDQLHEVALSSDVVMVNQNRHLVTVPERTVLMLHGAVQDCYPEHVRVPELRASLVAQLAPVARLAACSRWAADSLAEVVGRDVDVLYPPVDDAFFSAVASKRPVVGFSGRLSRFKGADVVLALAGHELLAGVGFEVTRFAADEGMEEPFVAAQEAGLVRLVEPFDSAGSHAAHLASLGVLVVPSRVEGFGLLAAEAQAAGTFVVASRVGGLSEAVLPGGGVLTDGSLDALAGELARSVGRAVPGQVRRDVASRFSTASVASRLLELF